MIRKLALTILTVALACGQAQASVRQEIQVGGSTRTFFYYVPDGLKDNAPLVLALHGAQGSGDNQPEGFGWDVIAERDKIVIASPSSNGAYWDLGGTSDVDLILAVIDEMARKYKIDRTRVYSTGWSMGGMMSYVLACRLPDQIAAIGPSSGYPFRGGYGGCNYTRSPPILHIHGQWDDFVKYSDLHGWLSDNSMKDYGCPTTADESKSGVEGMTNREYWAPCEKDGKTSEITLCTWWKAHSYGKEETEVFWNFFKAYSTKDPVPPSAVFFQNGNFKGHILRLVPGSYTHERLNKAGLMDSAIASMRVDPGATIEFFDNDNFQNPIATYTGNEGDLSSVKDKVTAIRVTAGPVIPPITVPTSRDTVFNGGFNLGKIGWTFNVWGGGARGTVEKGEFKIEIDSIGEHTSGIQVVQNGIILEQGKAYEVKFDAYAAAERTLEANVELDVDPWTSYLPAVQSFDLKTAWTPYSFSFNMTNPTDSNGRISFNAGGSTETVYLDNVSIKQVPLIPEGVRTRVGSLTGRIRWSNGNLLLSGKESGRLEIIDSRGRSKTLEVVGGRAATGSLPAGIYQARFVGEKPSEARRFTVLP